MSFNRTAQQNNLSRLFSNEFDRHTLIEKFDLKPCLNADLASVTEATREPANPRWEILGTNCVSACSAFARGGGVTLTTTTASADQVILTPHLDTAQGIWAGTKWSSNDSVAFHTKIKTGASIAAMILWAGLKLTNTPVVATDADQVFLRYEAGVNGGRFQLIYSPSNVDYTIDTGVTVEVSTSYEVLIYIDETRKPKLYINGTLIHFGANALTASKDFIPYLAVQASEAAAKAFTCRGVAMSKNMND